MFYTTTAALIVATAILARAQSNGQDAYLASVCMPTNSSGSPNLDVPCNAVAAIQAQCMYGPGYIDELLGSTSDSSRKRASQQENQDDSNDGPALQSNETQRVCICESQFWDQIAGCLACYRKHGSLELEGTIPESALSSTSSTYCAASATASVGFADFIYSIAIGVTPTASSAAGIASVKYADPLGNKTEISYYYTQAVTGTAAWSISQPTATSGSASYTTTNVQDGQIRPTASTTSTESSNVSGSGGSNATESGNAAGRYEVSGAAGLFGIAGLVAWL